MLKPALYVSSVPGERRILLLRDGRSAELSVERSGAGPFRHQVCTAQVEQWSPAGNGAYVSLGNEGKAFMGVLPGAAVPKPGERFAVTVVRGACGHLSAAVSRSVALPGPRAVAVSGVRGTVFSNKVRNTAAPSAELLLHHLRRAEVDGVVLREAALSASVDAVVHEARALRQQLDQVLAGDMSCAIRAETWHCAEALAVGRIASAVPADAERLRGYWQAFAPDLTDRISAGEGFPVDHYVDQALEIALSRELSFGSHGNLIFDECASMTAVQVTAFTTNKRDLRYARNLNTAAVIELARLLRLKNIGGPVVIDFLRSDDDPTAAVPEAEMRKAMAEDPAETEVFAPSASGLLEVRRERTGPSLSDIYFEPGHARTVSFDTVTVQLFRTLRDDAEAAPGRVFTVCAHPDYIAWLNARENRRTLLPASIAERTRWRPDASRPEREPYVISGVGDKPARQTETAGQAF